PADRLRVLIHVQRALLPLLSPSFSVTASSPPNVYTLSLHDALPISPAASSRPASRTVCADLARCSSAVHTSARSSSQVCTHGARSEEHTSELQSRGHLVCRLLLEKKKKKQTPR